MRSSGFTLIELLVVISIIGILSAVVTISFTTSQAQARDTTRMTDLKNLQLAIERYRADTGSFPAALTDLLPVYVSSLPDWGGDLSYHTQQSDGVHDRFILTIAGVESVRTDDGHEFACPDSSLGLVIDDSPCSGIQAEPNTVYAVYSEGVRTFNP